MLTTTRKIQIAFANLLSINNLGAFLSVAEECVLCGRPSSKLAEDLPSAGAQNNISGHQWPSSIPVENSSVSENPRDEVGATGERWGNNHRLLFPGVTNSPTCESDDDRKREE